MPTLKDLREQARLSQSELAKLCKVAPNTIYYWESGRTFPLLMQQRRLVEALKCTPDELWDALAETRAARERGPEVQKDLHSHHGNDILFTASSHGDALREEWLARMPTLKDLRDRALLSQSELARLCGVHEHTISFWETGATRPKANHRRALVQALHCSPDDLLVALQATKAARERRKQSADSPDNERPAA